MRPLRYYVDTSVWNFLLEEGRPEHRAVTERFFAEIGRLGTLGISEVVLDEMQRASSARRQALRQLVDHHRPELLELGVNGLNKMLGYREIEIVSPEEVIAP